MKEAILSFPNPLALAEFILANKIYKVRTDTDQLMVAGVLLDEQIELACKEYNAMVVHTLPVEMKS